MSENVEILCRAKEEEKRLVFARDTTEAVVDRFFTSIDLREFLKLKKLESLTISGPTLDDLDLSPLGDHPALVVFTMQYTKTKRPLDLSKLLNCRNLRELRIESYESKDDPGLDLSQLPVLPELKIFSIHGSGIRNPDIRILSRYSSLEEVDFGRSLHENLTFHPLSNLPHLKRVLVRGCGAETIDLIPLGTCTELEELVVTGLIGRGLKSIDLGPLSSCKNLRKLNLSEQYMSTLDLSPLREIPSFEELTLNTMPLLESMSLAPLGECRSLRALDLKRGFIEDDTRRLCLDFTPLSSSKTLEVLNLSGLSIDLERLSGLKSIQHLILSDCSLVRTDLSFLSGHSELRALKLDGVKERRNGKPITDISLEPLSNCKNLEYLDLGVNKISEIDLRPLAGCRKLKKLAVNNNPLKSLDLRPLRSCTELEELHVNNIGLKSIDLSALSNCETLRVLNAAYNYLEELDLRSLRKCRQLQVIYCQGNKLRTLMIDPSSDWSSLIVFYASNNQLQEIPLDFLRESAYLEELHLERNGLLRIDLNPLRQCTKLKRVDISGNSLKEIDLQPLCVSEELEYLNLSNNELEEFSFESISQMSGLHELDLHSTGLTAVDYDNLSKCGKLRTLDLSDNQIHYLELRRFAGLKNLTKIRAGISDEGRHIGAPLVKTPQGSNPECTIFVIPVKGPSKSEFYLDVNQESLELSRFKFNLDFLTQMKNLRSLTIKSTSMDEDDITKISKCEKLVSLSLEDLNTSSAAPPPSFHYLDLSFLSKMPNLESVSIVKVRGLNSVELKDIAKCRMLRNVKLDLSDTEAIDITPLAECENLRAIKINSKRLDMSEKARFRGLESFDLGQTRIKGVVLESLSECSSLKSLIFRWISCEEARLDLHPLSSLHNLSTLTLRIGGLDYLDVSPLMSLFALKEVSFFRAKVIGDAFIQFANPVLAEHVQEFIHPSSTIQEVVAKSGWQAVRSTIETAVRNQGRKLVDMWDQRALLTLFGLEQLASLDGSPLELLDEIPRDADYDDGLELFKQHLIRRLEEQVRSGGVSIFLDDDKLQTEDSAVLAQLVRERRPKEIEGLEILFETTIDLKPLWMTSIGFRTLREMKAGLECSVFFINEVEKKIGEHGLKLRTSSVSSSYSVNASEMMKQYIFDRACGHEKRPPAA